MNGPGHANRKCNYKSSRKHISDEWEDMFEDVNLSEVHCIDVIGTIEYPNVTKIANEMDMTRGAISKICKKAAEKGTSRELPTTGQ